MQENAATVPLSAHAPTACMIVIGNEVLSGRTADKNLSWIAKELTSIGIRLAEARVIPDVEQAIIDAVNACRPLYTYVFTSGGIGPTHDDITSRAIAHAFGLPLERSKEAEAVLEKHYGRAELNAARLKMADIPKGASLIANPVSAAPGFKIDNVHVMAGVPVIMQAMFDGVKHTLRGGPVVLSRTLSAYITEGVIAEGLSAIQDQYPHVEIGSYPFVRNGRLGTSLVARCSDGQMLDKAASAIQALLKKYTPDIEFS
jgi:molybdenum cofactor synthesis domain-containing protein